MWESLFFELFIYIATGAVVGFSAGLLGIGGGLIIVPVLSLVFFYTLNTPEAVHLAIGTSLATIIMTSLASVRAHHQHQAVQWNIVKLLAIGITAGAFLGGWSSQFISSTQLGQLFAFLEILIAIHLWRSIKPQAKTHQNLTGLPKNTLAGTFIGTLSSIIGIGGGTLTTPYLLWHNISIHHAIATSTAVSLPLAIAGATGYYLAGLNSVNLPDYATGYIYWPAFLGIVATSFFTAPIGARYAHKIPVQRLQKIFAIILVLLAIKMLIFV